MNKKWNILNPNPKAQAGLSNALHVHPIVAQLLINRNITDVEEAKQFLFADLSRLHDPYQLKDMHKAVDRVKKAQQDQEHVLIFGDYDVDGVTSSALLRNTLVEMGVEVSNHIPHRFDDGYGLNHEIGEIANEKGVSLLITVDCGITAKEEVKTLNKFGIDVIILDHHEPDESGPPNAFAIINPKQTDCPYPFKELASVGLVAKFRQALLGRMDEDVLDLVALGTIADMVPLRDENRIFAKNGLPVINKTKNVGLRALLELAKIHKKQMKPYYVGFILGPRINASGRMDSAHKSLELFLAEDKQEALQLAKELERHNTQRQKMQRNIVAEAMELVEQEVNFKDEKVIVLSKEGWHKGVLGIVASQLTDRYYRPSVVISLEGGVGTASARSIEGFHIHEALSSCANCLENFGGHEGAAGLTIKEDNIDPFRSLINQVADETLKVKRLIPSLSIDCEIPLTSVTMELADIVESMEPYGEANPSPIFCTRQLEVKGYARILGRDTIKFWVTDGSVSISAVGFGMGKFADLVNSGELIDLAYEISIDDWNKAPTVQLKLKDVRLSE